ncbi:hypothetical protein ACSQ67_017957 [Phaseolus vulgaris]
MYMGVNLGIRSMMKVQPGSDLISLLLLSSPLRSSSHLSSNSTFSISDQMLQNNDSSHSLPRSFSSFLNKYPTASNFVRIAIL